MPSNKAYELLDALNVREQYPNSVVSMITNVPSGRHGLKDILKLEGRELSESDIRKVIEMAPGSTINIIKDFEVSRKIKPE
jgi:aspartate carbamoyltransferase regulatory subunit